MEEALRYALQIIENYQTDIRSLELPGGAKWDGSRNRIRIGHPNAPETLAEIGFCQGRIYLEAIPTIKRMAGIE